MSTGGTKTFPSAETAKCASIELIGSSIRSLKSVILLSYFAGWRPVSNDKWTCLACRDNKDHTKKAAIRHEKSETHRSALKYHENRHSTAPFADPSTSSTIPNVQEQSSAGLLLMLEGMSVPDLNLGDAFEDSSKFEGAETSFETFGVPLPVLGKAMIAEALRGFLDDEEMSDEEEVERSDNEADDSADELNERAQMQPQGKLGVLVSLTTSGYEGRDIHISVEILMIIIVEDGDDEDHALSISHPRERSRNSNTATSKEWFPWPDKIVKILILFTSGS